jgi:hypothetical protein
MALKQPVVNMDVDANAPPALKDQINRWALEGRRMYKITFAVGRFAALVFGHDFSLSVHIAGDAPATRIWQVSPRFDWSPTKSLDAMGGVAAFHSSFCPAQEPSPNVSPAQWWTNHPG